MTSPPEALRLASEFPAATRSRWRERLAAVLDRMGVPADDEAPEQALASTTYDGITIAPLYTADDVDDIDGRVGLPGLPPFIRGGRPQGFLGTGWDVRARHADPDPAATNEAALADLEHGVSSLWLLAGSHGVPVAELGTALHGVLLDLATVVLDAGEDYLAAAETLLELHADRDVRARDVRCNLGADPIGVRARTGAQADPAEAAALAARHAQRYPGLRTIVVDATAYHDAGGSDAQELGYSIASGVAYLRALTEAGLTVDAAFEQLEFRYAVNTDQFMGIAKMRAARRLWDRVGTECGACAEARAQRQHAVTSTAMMTERDPWVNMLRTTVACFAAGIGGADAVTVQPFDSRLGIPDPFARRIARNSQAILLEESKLAGVIDPAGGSWYVESLTDALARAAWSVFTEIESAGGMLTALDRGLVTERIAATWSRRRQNVAKRADPITGVSEFPNLAEKIPTRKQYPAPARVGGGLPRVHYAQDYERLRTRSDSHVERHGSRPQVFLATLGPIAKHTARATFAANLFQAGGIETPKAGATKTVDAVVQKFRDSGASVACVCGDDSAYAEWLGKVAPALAEAGANRVMLAGEPTGERQSDVDDFVFAGCDALSVLTDTLETLGVECP